MKRVSARVQRHLAAACVALGVLAPAAHATPPSATGFSATNGGAPFAGDGRLLTTISPGGDGVRDAAAIHFTLDEPATGTLEILRVQPPAAIAYRRVFRLRAGADVLRWSPTAAEPGTYQVRLDLADAAGRQRRYDVQHTRAERSTGTPVIRVLGIDAGFTRESATPDSVAVLEIAADAPSLTLQFFRSGPEDVPTNRDGVLNGVEVTTPVVVGWSAHRNRPARLRVRIGAWETGFYYARLSSDDGRVGYAPLVVRPRRLGSHRVAVVLPTNTWAAYNFWDEDGDGIGDTWYAGCPPCTVELDRPYLDHGEPPHFRRYDLPFLHWLARRNRPVDYLTDTDLEAVSTGAELARAYDLIIFPGHHEYVTRHEYDVVVRFRNLGGNLIFLSANNFFWRVDRHGRLLRRIAQWRQLGRPEAALIGVQYRGNDRGERKGPYVVRRTAGFRWLFEGTGLAVGSRFTGFGYPTGPFGIEIDATAASSPPGTQVVAEIPNLFGPGVTAQMTYYETPAGAKVFAAGAFTLGGAAASQPVERMLDNLWAHLARP